MIYRGYLYRDNTIPEIIFIDISITTDGILSIVAIGSDSGAYVFDVTVINIYKVLSLD
jgi:hypothetical protein